jgi:rhodanese-related sulfurtransferase
MTRIAAFSCLGILALAGCRPDLSGLQVLGVTDLAAWRTSRSGIAILDANTDDTRSRYGVIPGAVLLSNYRDYDTAGELPVERGATLVFYCHSEMCGAAADAARKAMDAGYADVWVMAAGIKGWAEAGEPVESPSEMGGAS